MASFVVGSWRSYVSIFPRINLYATAAVMPNGGK